MLRGGLGMVSDFGEGITSQDQTISGERKDPRHDPATTGGTVLGSVHPPAYGRGLLVSNDADQQPRPYAGGCTLSRTVPPVVAGSWRGSFRSPEIVCSCDVMPSPKSETMPNPPRSILPRFGGEFT